MNFDPGPVIQSAYEVAKTSGVVQYVYVTQAGFTFSGIQPSPTRSHWKINPDGELDAHNEAHPGQKNYLYERS